MKSSRDIFYNLKLVSKKWEPYFDHYDRYFNKFVAKKPNVLEIGVANGGSMEMWHRFFENANLYGVDVNQQVFDIKFDFDVKLDIGNQADLGFWQIYLKDKPQFDVVIDDGGHEMNEQLNTLISVFPHLRPGGVYLIEDTHTSYWSQWGGGFRQPHTFIEVVKGITDLLNIQHIKDHNPDPKLLNIFRGLSGISFYNSVVVLEKDITAPFKEAVSFNQQPKAN